MSSGTIMIYFPSVSHNYVVDIFFFRGKFVPLRVFDDKIKYIKNKLNIFYFIITNIFPLHFNACLSFWPHRKNVIDSHVFVGSDPLKCFHTYPYMMILYNSNVNKIHLK
jgi:hypothetical protein